MAELPGITSSQIHTLAEICQASLDREMEARSHVVWGATMSVGGGPRKLEIWDCVQGQKRERQVGDREAVQLSPAFMNPAAD